MVASNAEPTLHETVVTDTMGAVAGRHAAEKHRAGGLGGRVGGSVTSRRRVETLTTCRHNVTPAAHSRVRCSPHPKRRGKTGYVVRNESDSGGRRPLYVRPNCT